jgi:hypothetical protein
MKPDQSTSGLSACAEILLSTMAALVAVAVVLFPSYSGLYGATKRAEQAVPAAMSSGFAKTRATL